MVGGACRTLAACTPLASPLCPLLLPRPPFPLLLCIYIRMYVCMCACLTVCLRVRVYVCVCVLSIFRHVLGLFWSLPAGCEACICVPCAAGGAMCAGMPGAELALWEAALWAALSRSTLSRSTLSTLFSLARLEKDIWSCAAACPPLGRKCQCPGSMTMPGRV